MSGGGQTGGRNPNGSLQKPSWAGGSTPSTFDPKNFGTQIMSDMQRVYGHGPQVNPTSSYTPFSQQTQDLIGQGFQDNADLRSGNIGDIARGGVNIGPDYTKGIMGDVASGKYLGNGNPFLNDQLTQTNDSIVKDVGSMFGNSGRFGGKSFVDTLGTTLGNTDNTARFNQYNTDYGNMTQALGLQGQQAQGNLDRQIQARGMLDNGTAQALGYGGMLDSKAQQLTDANRSQWDAEHNAGFNHIAQYYGLLNGGNGSANSTNKPLSIWDILGGVGSVAGAFL